MTRAVQRPFEGQGLKFKKGHMQKPLLSETLRQSRHETDLSCPVAAGDQKFWFGTVIDWGSVTVGGLYRDDVPGTNLAPGTNMV